MITWQIVVVQLIIQMCVVISWSSINIYKLLCSKVQNNNRYQIFNHSPTRCPGLAWILEFGLEGPDRHTYSCGVWLLEPTVDAFDLKMLIRRFSSEPNIKANTTKSYPQIVWSNSGPARWFLHLLQSPFSVDDTRQLSVRRQVRFRAKCWEFFQHDPETIGNRPTICWSACV